MLLCYFGEEHVKYVEITLVLLWQMKLGLQLFGLQLFHRTEQFPHHRTLSTNEDHEMQLKARGKANKWASSLFIFSPVSHSKLLMMT